MTEAALELQHLQGDQQILKAVAPAQALRQAAADQAISGGDAGAERAVVSRDERHLIRSDQSSKASATTTPQSGGFCVLMIFSATP